MSEKPKRVQRSRKKGWRMPPDAIYVGRPSRWGNPFKIQGPPQEAAQNRKLVKELYDLWMVGVTPAPDHRVSPLLNIIKEELAGHDLVCWCPLDQPCHADVLLELANS